MAAAGGGDDALAALDALRTRVVATGGPAGVSKTLALEWLSFAEAPLPSSMLDAEELAAECEGAPALEVDGVLDMT